MKRIAIVAAGTYGDVQPHVALAKGLQAAGYSVCLVTHAAYASLVHEYGVTFASLAGDPHAFLPRSGRVMAAARGNALKDMGFLRQLMREQHDVALRALDDCWHACQGVDAIIASTVAIVGPVVAERLGVPAFSSALQPLTQTGAFPLFLFPPSPVMSAPYNRLTYKLTRRLVWAATRRLINGCRQRLGLPAESRRIPLARARGPQLPVLYGFSEHVVPKPPDWGRDVHVTGYWPLEPPASWSPPTEITQFLTAGAPPVYVGFGSSRTSDPEATAVQVRDALQLAGVRGVLGTGWGGLGGLATSPTILQVEAIPHAWLFPRVAAVVHHCGAGTMAAALRAGVPSVPVPFDGDKPFWAQRAYELGVAPKPIPWKQLSSGNLAEAIRFAVGDVGMRDRAKSVGDTLRAERGVDRAVKVVQAHLGPAV